MRTSLVLWTAKRSPLVDDAEHPLLFSGPRSGHPPTTPHRDGLDAVRR